MKLVLELSEKDVQVKLDAAIGERVAKITDNYISQKVAAIIDTKLERADIEKLLREAAEKLIKSIYGEPSHYQQKYGQLLREEACKLLTERINKKGLDE